MNTPTIDHFLVERSDILERLSHIDPRAYDKTRNHLSGDVTWLGPFLTHGIISTTDVANAVLRHHSARRCYRLLFELAWREFFHRTWQHHGTGIFQDMREASEPASHIELPVAVVKASTRIDVIDHCVQHLLEHGTMHNHVRMWVAAITCNQADTHWYEGARWMHAHLLDGDLASNSLSWQWIAGTFSDKRYRANQDNINRFSESLQSDSWLDVDYDALPTLPMPAHMHQRQGNSLEGIDTTLPGKPVSSMNTAANTTTNTTTNTPLLLRSIWSLNPDWHTSGYQQIVFIDTAHTRQWPLSAKRWRLIQHWAERCGADLYHGSVQELQQTLGSTTTLRQEYPSCNDWPGTIEPRSWLYPDPAGPYPSFSRFWKQVRQSIGL